MDVDVTAALGVPDEVPVMVAVFVSDALGVRVRVALGLCVDVPDNVPVPVLVPVTVFVKVTAAVPDCVCVNV